MKSLNSFCCLAFCLATSLSCTHAIGQEKAAKATPGISQTKPESGPFVAIDGGKGGYMVPYIESIERTNINFEMIPIPGGSIKLGSPDSEPGHAPDESGQFTVELEPFWMAKTELTWGEYKTFMRGYNVFKDLSGKNIRQVDESNKADAITVPTPLYQASFTYEYGDEPKQPAVTMTQYSAKQYTKWLSGMTGTQYRIPTEAEWEYAARAGSTTAYSFGEDEAELDKYAVYADNAPQKAALVGSKAPNAFGLHDMHGNVWEWTIDQYTKDGYGSRSGKTFKGFDGANFPTVAYPLSLRGGGWQDPADRVRSAVRMGTDDEDWKAEDPNIPLSPWWFTSDPSRMVGMRLVRSAKPLAPEMIKNFWEITIESIQQDVDARLKEGRGAQGLAVPELIKEFQRKK